jgi:hypothetical protein
VFHLVGRVRTVGCHAVAQHLARVASVYEQQRQQVEPIKYSCAKLPVGGVMKNAIAFLVSAFSIGIISVTAQAQALFVQTFPTDDTTDPFSAYESATPDNTQFDQISTGNNANCAPSITSGALQFARSSNTSTCIASRNTDFSPSPSVVTFRVDLSVSGNTTVATTAARFRFGSGFGTGNADEVSANTYAQFGINFTATDGTFSLRNIDTSVNSGNFSGTQTITLVLNNSGSAITYLAPDGNTETLANDTLDLFIEASQFQDDVAVLTASQVITDFKFISANGIGVIRLDNFRMDSSAVTAVGLQSINASALSGGVLFEWRTGYESDNLGFNIYREKKGRREQVNSSLLAGSAFLTRRESMATGGDSYSFIDAKGSPDYVYYLEDIDLNGTRTMHGPIAPTGGAVMRAACAKTVRAIPIEELNTADLKQTAARRSQRSGATSVGVAAEFLTTAATPKSKAAQRQKLLAAMSGPKLAVNETGWYRVSLQALVAAGLDAHANKEYLQLYADGVQVPLKVNTDSIEFYGVGLNTPSSDTRQYWLIPGISPGRRITQWINDGVVNVSPTSYEYTVERKERLIYFSSLLNGDAENFFGRVINNTPHEQTLSVFHLHAGDSESRLEVAVQGATLTDHAVKVLVNENEAGVLSFSGMSHHNQRLSLGSGMLREGDNTVSLQSLNGGTDVSLVDYLRLTYAHRYQADGDYLEFTVNGNARVSGFSVPGVKLLDITDPNAVSLSNPSTQPGPGGYSFIVEANQPRRYLALTEQGTKQVAAITRNQPSKWNGNVQGADMVVITHQSFRSQVEPLAQLRRQEGMTVAVVEVEDLYDEFSYGVHSPAAIRNFLKWTTTNWLKAPRFVLLVGDGSYDPRNYLGNGETDLVPARLVDTAMLETVSDDWFVDFTKDGKPEMAIGRLPARTPAEAETMITKIVNYSPVNEVQSALMVADRIDARTNFNFESASEELGGMLPATIGVQKVFRGDNSNAVVRDQVIGGINQGPLLVSFLGHGSVEVWTGGPILSATDVSQLNNGQRLPVFLLMTCLNGYYQNPTRESLAESFLRNSSGGAVAVWASSGMTEPFAQMEASRILFERLFSGEPITLGDAIRKAKSANGNFDVRRTWILLGDPSMRLTTFERRGPNDR